MGKRGILTMNYVILSGRLTKDPDVRYSQGENAMAVAKFTLAVDKNFKRNADDKANFINCTCFGKTGEVVEKHCRKGTKLIVTGEWTTGSYKNRDGNTVYTNDCNVSKLEFCESKSQNSQPAPVPMPSNGDGWMNIPEGIDDSLPFA